MCLKSQTPNFKEKLSLLNLYNYLIKSSKYCLGKIIILGLTLILIFNFVTIYNKVYIFHIIQEK